MTCETSQPHPKLHRMGTRPLDRGQYMAMTHPQCSAVLVLGVDVSSHSAGGRIEDLRPQVHALLTRRAEAKRSPAWIGGNPLSGKCHLLWMINLIAAVTDTTSPNTCLLTTATSCWAHPPARYGRERRRSGNTPGGSPQA